ncbi:MAG: 1-acyl-sn-glycerol-3-phosphate acyltransferase [Candidatus Obscuribacter sp.]|nr:1-acyl-sn-glycerol-3-phosphate acyltransferase [Candidatus Obscuribacter sp.]
MGAFGCFAVDRSKGRTVIEPAIKVLENGESLVVFPEGKSPTPALICLSKGPSSHRHRRI